MAKRSVVLETLPGEKYKLCIHLLVRDPKGACATRGIIGVGDDGRTPRIGPMQAYVVCQPQRKTIKPTLEGGKYHPFATTVDPRVANCPRCMADPVAQQLLASNAAAEQGD